MQPETEERFNFKSWYADHGEDLNKSRRNRYAEDPEYRARVLKNNQKSRARRRQERRKDREAEADAQKVKSQGQPWKTVEVERGGKKTKLFSVGALARVLGCSVQVIRIKESRGEIPEPKCKTSKGDRMYTLQEIEAIAAKLGSSGLKPAPRRLIEKWCRFGRGPAQPVKFAQIGTMAEALGRTTMTVENMERRGVLPATPFRATSRKRRLYTPEMVVVAADAMAAQGVDPFDWKAFHDTVLAGWEKLGVMNGRIVDPPKSAQTKSVPKPAPKKAAPKKAKASKRASKKKGAV